VIVVETKPYDADIGSEIVHIVDMNSDSISFDLLIGNNFGMVSVGYDDITTNERNCYQDFNMTEGDKIHIEEVCYEKFASFTVFFYDGDDFDIDVCEACTLPSDGTEGYTAITFEAPCACKPNNEPSSPPASLSPPPTPCDDQVDVIVIDTEPHDVDIGSEIVNIVDLNSDSISFEVLIGDEFGMVSVGYNDITTYQRQCYQDFNMTEGDKIPIDASCVENVTSFTVYFYNGHDFDSDECEACSLPSDGTEGYFAIVFEAPCESSCESPSPAPKQNYPFSF